MSGPSSTLKPFRQKVRCRIAGGVSTGDHIRRRPGGGISREQTLRIWVRDVGTLYVVTAKGVPPTRKRAVRGVAGGWAGSR